MANVAMTGNIWDIFQIFPIFLMFLSTARLNVIQKMKTIGVMTVTGSQLISKNRRNEYSSFSEIGGVYFTDSCDVL